MTFSIEAREWLSESTGIAGRYLDIARRKGSTSSSVYRIRDSRDATAPQYVLRVLDNEEWLSEEADLAAHEAAALVEAERADLRAPRLVAYAKEDVGFGAPVVLMTFIDGIVELRPVNFERWLEELAGELAAIHRHRADGFPWRFRSWVERDDLVPPVWATAPRLWERAIELHRGEQPALETVFIHRDFHPTNVLWHNGSVSGVVDWINACTGPAGVDVGHCRTNLAMIYGPDGADRFLGAYRKAVDGFHYDPYWDVETVLDMCLPEPHFYSPWQTFGLNAIGPKVLQRRVEAHLERVMSRV